MVITAILRLVTTFGRKGWLKIDVKSYCWRLKGGRQIVKSVFIFLCDARYKCYKSRSNSQIVKVMVIIPILSYLPLLGMKG